MDQEDKPQEDTKDDPQPGGDPPTGVIPKRKRRRLDRKKVDQSKIVDIQSLPANPLLEAQVFNKRPGLQVKVFEGNKVYVVNTGDADASIPFGAVLCGYGKGRFDRIRVGMDFLPARHPVFEIKTCDDLVVYGGATFTVKEVMRAKRITYPEAEIAYHSVFEVASTDTDAFGVKLKHEVFFIPAFFGDDDQAQSQPINQSTLAGKLPANIFDNSHCVVATWVVKWSPQGLGPVRPLVIFKKACDLPAGKALSLM